MKTENQKQMTDAVHEYFATYSIGDVLQVLSNVSFDHLKTMLQVGNIDKETEINKTASTMSMITDLMALLGTLYECETLVQKHGFREGAAF